METMAQQERLRDERLFNLSRGDVKACSGNQGE